MNLHKNRWYRISWKLGDTERTSIGLVISNYDSGYLFHIRSKPNDPKDEYCMGIAKEKIIKIEKI